jgi:copper chaperone CopZ
MEVSSMPQMTLFAPDIFCEHCTMTISETVEAIEGARYVAGDHESRSFVVELERGEVLDRIAEALAAEGYPLGPASPAASAAAAPDAHEGMTMLGTLEPASRFRPEYRPERSEVGAEVVYSCPCGSTTEVFHYDRSRTEQEPHSCCGHHVLVAPDASEALRARLGDGYDYDVQTIEMPWGQPMEAVMAVPRRE